MRPVVLLRRPCGAVVGVSVPAGDLKRAPAAERDFAYRVGLVAAALRRGLGIPAQRHDAERLLAMLEALEAVEERPPVGPPVGPA